MLAGKFQLAAPEARTAKATALALALALRPDAPAARPTRRWSCATWTTSAWARCTSCPDDQLGEVPVLGRLGVDIISDAFTLDAVPQDRQAPARIRCASS